MNDLEGALSFGTAVDMTGFDEGQQKILDRIAELGEKAEAQGMKLHDFIDNIPAVDLGRIANVSSLEQVTDAFKNIDYVMDASREAVKQLEAEYERLGMEMSKAFQSGKDDEYIQLKNKQNTVKELIALRKKLMSTTNGVAKELSEYEGKLKQAANTIKNEANEEKKSEASHVSLRQRIKELKDELVQMEAAGQRNTDKYRQIQAEAARLTDAWADATKQASVIAHDQKGFQGIISGLSGVSGAFTAAQGAVSLFAGENEDLQKIMLKVQSLMAITMGLQQVQATLDKDSAFRLVTLNGLKEWWNKLLAIGAGNATKEAAATAIDTSAQSANATATTADATAKEAKAAAATGAAAAEVTDTTVTTENAVVATTGAKANIGLAGAFRMVGAAIKSIPVFGWIVAAIGALAGYVSHLAKKSKEAAEAMKEQHEVMNDANKAYIDAKVALQNNVRALETFNGTQAQEKKLIDDLNTKYGSVLGYYKTRAEWLDVLIEKGEAYCQSLLLEAKTEALAEKYKEAYVKRLEVEAQVADGTYFSWWDKRVKYNTQKIKQLGNEAINEAKKEEQKWEQLVTDAYNDLEGFKDENGLNFHPTPETITPKAANNVKKAIDDYKEAIKSYIKDADGEITDLIIASQEDGLEKELAASKLATQRRLDDWENQLRTLAKQRKELLKAQYMSKEGATEEKWEKSDAGKKTEDDYMKDILNEGGEISEKWYAVQAQITENGEKEIIAIKKKYLDSWIEQYGNYHQKRLAVIEQYNKEEESLYKEGTVVKDESGNITAGELKDGLTKANVEELKRQRDEALAEVDEEIASRSGSYQRWLSEISSMTVKQLRQLLEAAKKALEQLKKDPSADPQKLAEAEAKVHELEEAIRNAALSPKEEDIQQWRFYANELDEVGGAIKSLGDEMDGMAGEALSMFGTIMQSTSSFIKGIADVAEKSMEAMKDTATTASKAIAAAQSSVAILAIIQAIYSAVIALRDFIDDNFNTDSGFGQFASDFLHFLTDSETMLENLAWSLLGPVGTLIGMLTSSNKNSDRQKHIKEIERLVDEYDDLNDQLDEFGRQADETFGATNAALRQQQIELKKTQIELLNAAIAEEEAMKEPDEEKIKNWKSQINGLYDDIYDLEQSAEDAIFGEGVKTAIENFADALTEAWAQGKNASEAANDYMRKMIKQTVMQAILDYTQASAKIEAIREKLKQYLQNDGIITEDERLDLERMAQQLMDEVAQEFEWAQGLFDDSGREGSQRGIATASQDSVDENNARLTTIQGHTYSLVQGLEELNGTANEILVRVTGIEANTNETNNKLDNMGNRVRNIENTIDDIQRNGIRIRG